MKACGEMNRGSRGPGIGWIPLSAEEAASMKARGAVFHDRARARGVLGAETCRIGVVFGFVDALSTPPEKIIGVHGMLIGKTEEKDADEGGWDYNEYAIRNDDPSIPSTHKGVSGSAAWRIDLPLDGSGNKTLDLEGVVFAEGTGSRQKTHRPRRRQYKTLSSRALNHVAICDLRIMPQALHLKVSLGDRAWLSLDPPGTQRDPTLRVP